MEMNPNHVLVVGALVGVAVNVLVEIAVVDVLGVVGGAYFALVGFG